MRLLITFFLLAGFLVACNEPPKDADDNDDDDRREEEAPSQTTTVETTAAVTFVPSAAEYANVKEVVNDEYGKWQWHDSIGTHSSIEIRFTGDTLIYDYRGRCRYYYPFKIFDNEIVVYWSWDLDCADPVGIDKDYGVGNRPKEGDPFIVYRMSGKSKLRAEYLFPEWTAAAGKDRYSGDSLYPKVLEVWDGY